MSRPFFRPSAGTSVRAVIVDKLKLLVKQPLVCLERQVKLDGKTFNELYGPDGVFGPRILTSKALQAAVASPRFVEAFLPTMDGDPALGFVGLGNTLGTGPKADTEIGVFSETELDYGFTPVWTSENGPGVSGLGTCSAPRAVRDAVEALQSDECSLSGGGSGAVWGRDQTKGAEAVALEVANEVAALRGDKPPAWAVRANEVKAAEEAAAQATATANGNGNTPAPVDRLGRAESPVPPLGSTLGFAGIQSQVHAKLYSMQMKPWAQKARRDFFDMSGPDLCRQSGVAIESTLNYELKLQSERRLRLNAAKASVKQLDEKFGYGQSAQYSNLPAVREAWRQLQSVVDAKGGLVSSPSEDAVFDYAAKAAVGTTDGVVDFGTLSGEMRTDGPYPIGYVNQNVAGGDESQGTGYLDRTNYLITGSGTRTVAFLYSTYKLLAEGLCPCNGLFAALDRRRRYGAQEAYNGTQFAELGGFAEAQMSRYQREDLLENGGGWREAPDADRIVSTNINGEFGGYNVSSSLFRAERRLNDLSGISEAARLLEHSSERNTAKFFQDIAGHFADPDFLTDEILRRLNASALPNRTVEVDLGKHCAPLATQCPLALMSVGDGVNLPDDLVNGVAQAASDAAASSASSSTPAPTPPAGSTVYDPAPLTEAAVTNAYSSWAAGANKKVFFSFNSTRDEVCILNAGSLSYEKSKYNERIMSCMRKDVPYNCEVGLLSGARSRYWAWPWATAAASLIAALLGVVLTPIRLELDSSI